MIKMALCDDELSVLNDLSALLDCYCADKNQKIAYFAFQSPFDLIAAVEKGARWDIILLDVMMPGQSGMELAKELRTYDKDVKIIFLTSSSDFAVQSYMVNAFFYQLKPIQQEELFSVLDRAIQSCKKNREKKLVLKCKKGITAISSADVEYCEVIGRNLMLHLKDGQVIESIGKLDELEKKLSSVGGFLRVHRSYLVNMAYIQNISSKAVTLSSMIEIPIPHGKVGEIKKAYLSYVFERETVLL